MGGKLTGVKLELMVDNGATPVKVDNGRIIWNTAGRRRRLHTSLEGNAMKGQNMPP